MDLCSTGFSLWNLVLARTNPHRLKPVPLNTKNKAPEGRARGGRAVSISLRSFKWMLGE
jgi:hypothetical protein